MGEATNPGPHHYDEASYEFVEADDEIPATQPRNAEFYGWDMTQEDDVCHHGDGPPAAITPSDWGCSTAQSMPSQHLAHATLNVWDGDRIDDDYDDSDDIYARDLAMAQELDAYEMEHDDYVVAPIGKNHISENEDASDVGAALLETREGIDMELEGTTKPHDGWEYERDTTIVAELDDSEKAELAALPRLAHEGLRRRV